MKNKLSKAAILLWALGLVFFVLSCAIWTGGSENGTISLSFSPSSKALITGATEARVWVYSNNVLVPNTANPEGFYSTSIGSGATEATITISDLPPGDSYRIVVAAFKTDDTTTVTAFGTSELFGVKAGVETAVGIKLQEINIAVPSKQIKNLVSVVYDGSTSTITAASTAASGSALYTGSSVTNLSGPAPWPTSNGTINSLNLTADQSPVVLVNTTKGIYDQWGSYVGTSNWGGTPPSVLQSGGLATLNTFFYQAEKEIGGYVGGNEWNRIELDIPVAGKPILDLLVWQKNQDTIYGYFATRVVGAFRVGSSDIENLKLEDILSGNEKSPIIFFGESLPLIQAFGYIGGDDLYLGTKSGVYKTSINTPNNTPLLIEGTKGLDVTKIVVHEETEAFLTAKELVILKGSKIYKMPFLTSVVGTLTDVAWKDTDLIVVGTNGICSVPTADL
jgi:hypothetical protein